MPRFCKTCGRDRADHPREAGLLGGGRRCEVVLVEDVELRNGEIRIVEADSPFPRTKRNNKRWMPVSIAPEELR